MLNAQPAEVTLPELPGFDIEGALKLLANNKKLYSSVLKRFAAQYSGTMDDIISTINAGTDFEVITREAHTIKGLAGTIGHPVLQAAALALETESKSMGQNAEAFNSARTNFIDEFTKVMDILKAAFPA